MTAHTTALVWFRRDLRLADNPALHYAIEHARYVVPVFIFAPDEEGDWAPGAASRWWLHQSLNALANELSARGNQLIIRRGPTFQALQQLIRDTSATLLTFNRLHDPAIGVRDRTITAQLACDVRIETHQASLLFEPGSIRNGQGQPYQVFTAFWRNASAQIAGITPPLASPRRIPAPTRMPKSSALDTLQLLPRIPWDQGLAHTWQPGERGARTEARRFSKHVQQYPTSRDRPDIIGTSRLSAHLHFGEIGPRQLVWMLRDGRQPNADAYVRQLGWREFAHHLLDAFPHTTTQPLDTRFERMRWSRRAGELRVWQRGQTGYPIVDAGMRELWHTGWMHNRVRMIVASFLTKNLQHHWLSGARWFWDTLVDADLANNTLGWQWTAGCGADAAPYYRVFNPVLQAERFDPARDYMRKWIPELAALPDRWIHRPWEASAAVLATAKVTLGKTYPRPIVCLAGSRAAALDAYKHIQSR